MCSDIDVHSSWNKLRPVELFSNKYVKEEMKHASITKNVRGFHIYKPVYQLKKNWTWVQ